VSFASRSDRALPVRRLSTQERTRDIAVAAVAFALTLGVMAAAHGASRGLDVLGVALAALACWPLPAHRRAPLATFAACTAASAAIDALGYGMGPPFGPTVALFYLAADPRTRDRMPQTAATVLGFAAVHLAAAAASYSGFPTVPLLGAIVVWGGAWIIGDQLRQRRERLADLVERAERAERETQRERRLAAAEERTRIARDLHDSAAHAINVILVQAGGARLLQERDPEAVRAALITIEDVARETIGEIDQLIRGLRENGDRDTAHGTVEPPAGLAAADTLAARHRAAGLPVQMRVDGHPRPLTPRLDQAAYRILQESLTNAARHGEGSVEVQIAYRDRQLELTVSNPLGSSANGVLHAGGHGILGMRERAALLGGSLQAGPADARFQVHALLPYALSDHAAS
jgi:signal transduction histidine kinase